MIFVKLLEKVLEKKSQIIHHDNLLINLHEDHQDLHLDNHLDSLPNPVLKKLVLIEEEVVVYYIFI